MAYRNKVDELLNQGLDEEELSKKMDLLKVSLFKLFSRIINNKLSNYI